MKTLKHILQQPFIFATGIAALIHSTWALGTLFSGIAPDVALTWAYISWIVPAVLIAFALDVGQISTSGQIRDSGLTTARGVTFVIFAFATYYLQWLYMAVHMPLLPISAGVTGVHYDIAVMLRNVGIWLIPALLPISTVSYTFSSDKPDIEQENETFTISKETDFTGITLHELADGELHQLPETPLIVAENPEYPVECICGAFSRTYDNTKSAKRGLDGHQQKCSIYQEYAKNEQLAEVIA